MTNLNVVVNIMNPTTAYSYGYMTTGITQLKPNTTYTVYLCAKCSQALRDANRYFVHYVYGSKTTGEWEWQHPTYCYGTEPTVVRSTFTTSSNTSAINGVGCYNFPGLSSAPEEQNSTCYWYKVIEGDVDVEVGRGFSLTDVLNTYSAIGYNNMYGTTPITITDLNQFNLSVDGAVEYDTTKFEFPTFHIKRMGGNCGISTSKYQNTPVTVSWDAYVESDTVFISPFNSYINGSVIEQDLELSTAKDRINKWVRLYATGTSGSAILFYVNGLVDCWIKNIKISINKQYLDSPPGYSANSQEWIGLSGDDINGICQVASPLDLTDFLSAQQHIRHLRFFNGNNVLDGSFGYVGTSWPSGWQDNGGSSSRVSNIEKSYMGFPSIQTILGTGIAYNGWIQITPGETYTTMCLMYTESEINPNNSNNIPIHAWFSKSGTTNDGDATYIDWSQHWPGGSWKWGYTTWIPNSETNYIRPYIYYGVNSASDATTAYIQAVMIVKGPIDSFKHLAAWIGYRYPISTLSYHSSGTQLRYLYSDGALDSWIPIDSGGATGNSLLTTSYSNWEYNDTTRSRSIMAFFDDGGLDIDSQEELAETEIEYGDWKYEGGNISRTREVTIKYTYPDETKVEHTSETEYGKIEYGDWKYDNINRTRSISYIYYDITKSGGWSTETADLKELVASTTYVDKYRTNLVNNGPTWIDSNGDRKTVIITGNYIFYDDTHVNRDLTNVCEYIYITKDIIKVVLQTTELQFNISDLNK